MLDASRVCAVTRSSGAGTAGRTGYAPAASMSSRRNRRRNPGTPFTHPRAGPAPVMRDDDGGEPEACGMASAAVPLRERRGRPGAAHGQPIRTKHVRGYAAFPKRAAHRHTTGPTMFVASRMACGMIYSESYVSTLVYMASAPAGGPHQGVSHRLYVCPLPVPPLACAVIQRSGAGIAGTIACARAAGSSYPSSPQRQSPMPCRAASA